MTGEDRNRTRDAARAARRGARLASMGLPADADCELPCITLTGNRYLRVEHHRGILRLTDTCARFYSCLGTIRIEGEGLCASDMDGDVLLIDGRIKAICIE